MQPATPERKNIGQWPLADGPPRKCGLDSQIQGLESKDDKLTRHGTIMAPQAATVDIVIHLLGLLFHIWDERY